MLFGVKTIDCPTEKAAWEYVLEGMRRAGVKRIYSHHGNHLPKITTKLAQLGGMSMFHRHPEGVFTTRI